MTRSVQSLEYLTVEELLAGRHRIVEIEPSAAVHVASKRMVDNRVGALLVSAGDGIEGIFTERDVLTRVVCKLRDPATVQVGEVMTRDVHVVDIHDSVAACQQAMQSRRIRHLPVVKAGRPVAMLSIRDLLRAEIGAQRHQVEDLELYFLEYR